MNLFAELHYALRRHWPYYLTEAAGLAVFVTCSCLLTLALEHPDCVAGCVLVAPLSHLRADADEQQVAFEIHALILALHYEARFLRSPGSLARAEAGFDNILARHAVSPAAA